MLEPSKPRFDGLSGADRSESSLAGKERARPGEVVSPVRENIGISERYACQALEQPHSSQRYVTATSVQEELIVRGHKADGQVRSASNGTTQPEGGMSVVGQCAAEKADRGISKFDETAIVC